MYRITKQSERKKTIENKKVLQKTTANVHKIWSVNNDTENSNIANDKYQEVISKLRMVILLLLLIKFQP